MSDGITRRSALRIGVLGTAAASVLASCSPTRDSGGSSNGELRFSSYGDPTKLKVRSSLADLYMQQNQNIHITFEGSSGAAYADKLSAQIAASNAPDVINLPAERLVQYGRSGVLLDLAQYIPKVMDTTSYDKRLLSQGQVDGKQYAIPVAQAVMAVMIDTTGFKSLGITPPDGTWTWEKYVEVAAHVHDASKGKLYGSWDPSGDYFVMETWVLGRGESMFKDGKLGFGQDTLSEWFQFWADARSKSAISPAAVAAQYIPNDWTTSPIAKRTGLMIHAATSNFTGGLQKLTDHNVDMVLPPMYGPGGSRGVYPRPSSFLAANARTQSGEEAVKFVNWFLTSKDAAQKLRLISGVPGAGSAITAVKGLPDLTPDEKEILQYSEAAAPVLVNAPENPPAKSSGVLDALRLAGQDVAFGRSTVSKSVARFFTDAKTALS